MKKRLWNIYHCCAFETACLLLSRWIKDPQSLLVCEVAASEAQSRLHGISFCGNGALKIDAIHQCNPPSNSSFLCDFMEPPCHFRYKHLICNHHAPKFKLLVALVNLFAFWWLKWTIFILLSKSHYGTKIICGSLLLLWLICPLMWQWNFVLPITYYSQHDGIMETHEHVRNLILTVFICVLECVCA